MPAFSYTASAPAGFRPRPAGSSPAAGARHVAGTPRAAARVPARARAGTYNGELPYEALPADHLAEAGADRLAARNGDEVQLGVEAVGVEQELPPLREAALRLAADLAERRGDYAVHGLVVQGSLVAPHRDAGRPRRMARGCRGRSASARTGGQVPTPAIGGARSLPDRLRDGVPLALPPSAPSPGRIEPPAELQMPPLRRLRTSARSTRRSTPRRPLRALLGGQAQRLVLADASPAARHLPGLQAARPLHVLPLRSPPMDCTTTPSTRTT